MSQINGKTPSFATMRKKTNIYCESVANGNSVLSYLCNCCSIANIWPPLRTVICNMDAGRLTKFPHQMRILSHTRARVVETKPQQAFGYAAIKTARKKSKITLHSDFIGINMDIGNRVIKCVKPRKWHSGTINCRVGHKLPK